MAACCLRARVFLLLPLLSAGLGEVNVITPDYPVNGSLGHSVWLPVEIDPIPNGAEIIWRFTGSSEIVVIRYDTSTDRTKIFPSRFAGRVQMFVNFTLQINALERIDEGIYTVSVVASSVHKKQLSLQVYEPVSKPRVELVNTTIGQPCMVTLRCSVERGDRVLYSWSPVGYFDRNDSIQPVSRNMEQLELSVGSSDSINYLCTAQNPVSEESTVFSKDKPCQHTQEDSTPLDQRLPRAPTIPNNYENGAKPQETQTIYAVVQRPCST
ncbi:signaling lymphocytic activation molecule-like isoform X2 [Scyliorhinus canicula]|uniref:signaling lymphocytic activation molecule-like isoform X2 n=1 Tax=Scyliorhinus canicula TaxID=7830 RepID=UPI0018F794A8|nr:signaling lymphocytic activation molecule-like isoform X2 [Scyliorhinus canicula]